MVPSCQSWIIYQTFTYKNAEYTCVWSASTGGQWTVTKQSNTVTAVDEISDTRQGSSGL